MTPNDHKPMRSLIYSPKTKYPFILSCSLRMCFNISFLFMTSLAMYMQISARRYALLIVAQMYALLFENFPKVMYLFGDIYIWRYSH